MPSQPQRAVLIVCHANTSRSVMAHVLLEKMLSERGIRHVRVSSGGIAEFARDGMLPSLDARLVLKEENIDLAADDFASIDLRRHRELMAGADLIVTMTGEQRERLKAFSEVDGKVVWTLRELAGESGDIADPASQGEEAFRAALREIKRCLEKSLDRLLAALDRGGPCQSAR
jgi:protein-tyrosine phosphatase